MSSTPSIEIDDTDSCSDESDGEEEEINPGKKVLFDGEEVINLQWLQIEKCILTPSDQALLVEGSTLMTTILILLGVYLRNNLQMFLDYCYLCYNKKTASQNKQRHTDCVLEQLAPLECSIYHLSCQE